MNDGQKPPSLEDLDARLRRARDKADLSGNAGRYHRLPHNPLGIAWRIGTELVAAMIVGVGGGILFDRWLGTAPWGLVVMFFLGAAAGVLNVYRSVTGLGYATGYGRTHKEDHDRPHGDGQ